MQDEQQTAPEAAPEEAAPAEVDMGELYDKLTAEGIEPDGEESPEAEGEPEGEGRPRDEKGRFAAKEGEAEEAAPEDGEEAEAEDGEDADARSISHLPRALREKWDSVPEEVRATISDSHAEMSRKLADAGRRDKAIGPIYEKVIEAAERLPVMADMEPKDIADAMFQFAQIQQRMQADPVNTFMDLANRYGVLPVLQQMASGKQPTPNARNEQQLMQHIQGLEKQIQQLSDPSRVESMIDQRFSVRSVNDAVSNFAESADHWGEVEEIIPDFIPAAQRLLGDDASHADVLKRAYKMAVNERGLQATPKPKADPKRIEAVKKAKSTNVTSRSTGKTRPLSEREELSRKYDELTRAS